VSNRAKKAAPSTIIGMRGRIKVHFTPCSSGSLSGPLFEISINPGTASKNSRPQAAKLQLILSLNSATRAGPISWKKVKLVVYMATTRPRELSGASRFTHASPMVNNTPMAPPNRKRSTLHASR